MEHRESFHKFQSLKKIISILVGLIITVTIIILFACHLIVVVNGQLVLSNTHFLEIHHSDVTNKDLENLKYLTKLEHLWIYYTPQITDISFVSEMKDLKSFSIGSPSIVNLDSLKNCKNLETLYLSHTNLANLDYFSENTELKILYVEIGNPVQDISALQNMGKLEELYISSSKLKNISPISSLYNLTCLSMSCNSINDLSPLVGCKRLKYLSLIDCAQVTDISQLVEMSNLEEINICGTAISDFTPLLSIKCLKKVVANEGQIDSSTYSKLKEKNITVLLF